MTQSSWDAMDKNSLKVLSRLYFTRGEYAAAKSHALRILAKDRKDKDALYLVAQAQESLCEYAGATETLRRLIRVDASYLKAYLLLAQVHKRMGKLQEEIDLLEAAVSFLRDNASAGDIYLGEAWSRLGSAYVMAGESRKAMQCFLESMQSERDEGKRVQEYSNYLFVSNYAEGLSSQFMRRAHARYADFFKGVRRFEHAAAKAGEKRLRIGYISPDFRTHPVLAFAEVLLTRFDRARYEVFCYFVGEADQTTLRLKQEISNWRDIRALLPSDAATRIHADQIDILVELAGHTRDNALPVLARKPAPIQVCGIGYFNTTGLREVDYFLTDIHCDPPGENDADFTEKLLRLPRTHLCYRPPAEVPAPCGAPPCTRKGFVTFGCFNNFSKVTDRLLGLWGRLLAYQPQARLLLKSKIFTDAQGRALARRRFEAMGLDVTRVEMRPFTERYLHEYGEVDIALDTYPYPGGATTCEALYMGVPVVSLYGRRHGSRFGYSLLRNAGLEELAVADEAGYLAKALALAEDWELLVGLRRNLRSLIAQSNLMDEQRYVSDVEEVYEKIWRTRCGASG